jgi:NADP-dependent 3-hydroxy acid dehydrogenase YdfG
MELINYGIKVTVINPGAAETEFSIVRFKGDIQKAKNVYSGYKPLVAEDIANVIWFAASLPPHVNITELTVMPAAQATTTIFNKNI